MADSLLDQDTLIYREMMTHIPLFAHRNPKTIAILDDHDRGMTEEILKHPSVTTVWQTGVKTNNKHTDSRMQHFADNMNEFLLQAPKNSLDVLIIGSTTKTDFNHCIKALHNEGIYIQLCESFFDLLALKNIQQQLQSAGFSDILPLNFPQSHFVLGSRAAVMAIKEGTIKCPRERDIFNKPFTTKYYNFDMHKAAFALPEFMREALVTA
jgi:spermidine synthase